MILSKCWCSIHGRDAARYLNRGGLPVMRWAYSAPLVVIGLTELTNSKAHPAHPLAASLHGIQTHSPNGPKPVAINKLHFGC